LRPVKRGAWIIGCLCLTLAVGAAPAAAKKKKKPRASLGPVVTVTSTGPIVPTGSASSATATCPAGTQAVGGGYTSTFNAANKSAIFESYRSAGNTWTASAVVGVGSGGVSAFGYCRKSNRPILDVPASASLSGGGPPVPARPSATCPPGTRLISGGFQSTRIATSVGFPFDNFSPSAGTWAIRMFNSSNMGPLTVTAHAYCIAGLRAPTLVSATLSAPTPSNGTLTVITRSCPAQKPNKPKNGKKKPKKLKPQRLSAGGFSTPISSVGGTTPIFNETTLDIAGWRALATNTGSAGTMPVAAQGICA
jgi:hypothetical protein